jgi:hypothetical protein
MKPWDCPREPDVLDAVASRRWPDRDVEIAAHIERCAVCADLAEVVTALKTGSEESWSDATLPPGEVVWWRAQVRARGEAARVAARPIWIIQTLGAGSALGLAAALVVLGGTSLTNAASWLSSLVTGWIGHAPISLDAAGLVFRGIVFALGVWLALVPVAVFLASDDQ